MTKFSYKIYFQTQALALTRTKSPSSQKERSLSPTNPSNSGNGASSDHSPVCHRQDSPKSNVSNTAQHSSHSSSTSNISDHLQQQQQQRDVRDVSYERPSHLSGGSMSLKLSTSTSNSDGNAIIRENGPIDKILPSPVIDRKDFDFNKVNNGEWKHVLKNPFTLN